MYSKSIKIKCFIVCERTKTVEASKSKNSMAGPGEAGWQSGGVAGDTVGPEAGSIGAGGITTCRY